MNLPKRLVQTLGTPQRPKLFGFRCQDSTKEKIEDYPAKKFKKSIWSKEEDELLKLKVS